MTKKIQCISLYPSERSNYPDWYSKSELKSKKLMPKPNVKPVALVIRKSYGDYYLYDINKTKPYQLTKKQKDELRKKRKLYRERKLVAAEEYKQKHTCKVCSKYMSTNDMVYNIYSEDYYCYVCKSCYKDIYEKYKADYIKNALNKNIVCIDVETTGLSSYSDEILQVSAVDQCENTLINVFCKPERAGTWDEAELIHGITPAYVSDCKPYSYYKSLIISMINKADIIIGYNIDFDLKFLLEEDEYLELYNDDTKDIVDVMYLFAKVYGEWSNYFRDYKHQKLTTCANYYNYELNAHDSLNDAKATLYCYPRVLYDYNFNIYDYIN